ncbi:MAG: MFS transporter [Chloroflexi bacterium]|nr:MFS transporter [Chloroflexota bacterium]
MALPPLQDEIPAESNNISVNRLIVVGLITRLVTDTAVQIFFPFLPVLAKGWHTTSVAAGRLVSLRSFMGLFSPAFGVMADRRGYRFAMRLGLLLAALGYFIVGLSTNLWQAAVGMMLGGLGTFAFVPTLQAYLSIRLPFNRRARGMGMLEYAWAISGIVGLYLVGLLIEAYGWRVPMFVMSGLLSMAFLGYGRLPAARHQTEAETASSPFSWNSVRQFFELGNNRRSAWAMLAVTFFTMMAATNIFINYGTWLQQDYSLSAIQLGKVALTLGVADLSGSVLTSLIGDKVGLRRTVFFGSILSILGYGLLPLFNQNLVLAVIGLSITRFVLELAVVGMIALTSEQAPAHRGKMMTLAAAAVLFGSSLAGLVGPLLFEKFAVAGIGLASAVIVSFSLPILYFIVRERAEEM